MAKTSSTLAAAMTRVGIPLSRPQPLSERLRRLGTTTAGDTAAKTNLKLKSKQGTKEMKTGVAAT